MLSYFTPRVQIGYINTVAIKNVEIKDPNEQPGGTFTFTFLAFS